MKCEYMGMHNMSVTVRNVSACVGVSSCCVSVSASARECECMDMWVHVHVSVSVSEWTWTRESVCVSASTCECEWGSACDCLWLLVSVTKWVLLSVVSVLHTRASTHTRKNARTHTQALCECVCRVCFDFKKRRQNWTLHQNKKTYHIRTDKAYALTSISHSHKQGVTHSSVYVSASFARTARK